MPVRIRYLNVTSPDAWKADWPLVTPGRERSKTERPEDANTELKSAEVTTNSRASNEGDIQRAEKTGAKLLRFPHFHAQIFHFDAQNCIDTAEATI